jgi:hypothetical protein
MADLLTEDAPDGRFLFALRVRRWRSRLATQALPFASGG